MRIYEAALECCPILDDLLKHLFPPEYVKSLKEAAEGKTASQNNAAKKNVTAPATKISPKPRHPVSAARPSYVVQRSLPSSVRARGLTAVLGPTNTGKTHLAIERMLARNSGMIGLPLRLLAREVYQRVVEKVGEHNVALITGEEKIKPDKPKYWISTVEAMPRDLEVDFVAIDEIQLAADFDRGHVFTDRLLNQRGREETLLIGSETMRPILENLIPGIHITTRPRLSTLSFSGEKKITRLPRRSAIVAFSAEEVYAIAELIRRQRGGAAVVLGALSPRTRNAQVALYQSGDVDYLVATDAIGMGLNLDIDHVAFAADRKFDGFKFRQLFPAELAQIAGRAGRYMRDGTFGTAGRCPAFEAETISALENHVFDPVQILQWRNPDLDFSTLQNLKNSLGKYPGEKGLTLAPVNEDVLALENVSREHDIHDMATSIYAVERLWEVCQIPDYRKVSAQGHADLVATLYRFLIEETIPSEWFSRQLALVDRIDGDIDTLSNRIAQVRTWSFVANRPDWLFDPEHWQGVARQVEDKLSDALHERLAQRFIDRRTSMLMRRLRENAMLEAQISTTGEVTVEGQHVGHILGFQFIPETMADTVEAKTLRSAAEKALAGEIESRAERFSAAADSSLVIANDGIIRWTGEPVAKLEPGEKLYEPHVRLIADDQLAGAAREKVETRVRAWLKAYVVRLLGSAMQLEETAELTGMARGIAFQISEALGVLERSKVLQDVRGLDQEARGVMRRLGVRFGAYHLYLPALLKPAPRTLATQLWALKNGGLDQKGIDEIALLANSGRTSIPRDPDISVGLYQAAGFRICGTRAVRADILERLADLIRPAIAYRPGVTPGEPPAGAADGSGFTVTVAMTSLVGCAGEEFSSILTSLGYASDMRQGPAITVPLIPAAPIAGIVAHAADIAAASHEESAEEAEQTDNDTVDGVEAIVHEGQGHVVAQEVEAQTDAPADRALVGEASGEAAVNVEAEESAADAEPVLVEIWHQKRLQHDASRNRRPHQRFAQAGNERRAATEEVNGQDRSKRFGVKRDGQEKRSHEKKGQDRPRGKHQERRGPARDQSFDRKREDRKERQPDPNSPFAKLLALKDQLQGDKS